MATPRSVGLDTLLERHESKKMRQRGIALLGATAFLAVIAFFAPRHLPVLLQTIEETPVAHTTTDTYTGITLIGKAAVVYDLATGEVLFERNAKAQLPLASLTKLLTMYAAADTLSSNTPITITTSALGADGDSGFTAGETFAFADLARIALVASSNDATQAIALTASNARAKSGQNLLASAASAVGLSQTYELNGTGLDESISVSGAYGSATDVAKLAGALLAKAPDIARATTATSFSIQSATGVTHTLANTNPDVQRIPSLLLSKTGFTDLAGGNLVVVYDAGIGHPVALVVLGSTRDGRFQDVEQLLTRTYAHFAGLSADTPAVPIP